MNFPGRFAPDPKHTTTTEWGSLAWMVNSRLVQDAEMTVGLVTINVGYGNPVHIHPNCEEIVYVVAGRCDQIIAGKSCPLKVGEGLVIPRNAEHYSINTGDEPLVVLVCYSSPDRQTIFLDGGSEG